MPVSLNTLTFRVKSLVGSGKESARKYSNRLTQSTPSVTSSPESEHTSAPIMPSGFWVRTWVCILDSCTQGPKCPASILSSASLIILFQIGDAPVTPEATADIGELSLFPTQVATTTSGLYPIVQLSLLSLVVPVLTETSLCPLTLRKELSPKAATRALLSERICVIKKETSSLRTLSPAPDSNFSKTFPFQSLISRILTKSFLLPSFAKTPNASAMSVILTSPPPSVNESPY